MAELSCGGSCMKYILFLFNIIFFLCGAAILAIGIWAQVDGSLGDYITIINFNDSNPYFDQAVWLLIAVGAFIFLVGFLGCCGACYESSCMLALYATFVILVILAQIAVIVLAFIFRDNLGSELEKEMAEQAKNDVSFKPMANAITQAWNSLQYEFSCCGGYNYTDYYNSLYQNESKSPEEHRVPETCCRMNSFNAEDPAAENYTLCNNEAKFPSSGPFDELYAEGCYDSMVNWIEDHSWIIIGAALGIVIFELCGGAMLGVGIWALVDDSFSDYTEIVNFEGSNPYFNHAVYMLIAIGAIIFLVGFLGCCGALCESTTMLLFFAILLGLIVILQIAAGVLVVVFSEELGDELETEMSDQVKNHVTDDNEDPLTAAWNVVQVEFKCCGASGYQDYKYSKFANDSVLDVPLTCCVLNNTDPDNPQPESTFECQREARTSPDDFVY